MSFPPRGRGRPMPKAKTTPAFSKAAKMQGEEKAIYLARGELNPAANQLVLNVKHSYLAQLRAKKHNCFASPGRYAEAAPYGLDSVCELVLEDLDANERLIAGHKAEVDWCGHFLTQAILNQDSDLFRQIADVMNQHDGNGEHVNDEGRLSSRPTAALEHDIAVWTMLNPNLPFAEFWKWLTNSPQWAPTYGTRKTAPRVKSAQTSVRKTAKGIGIVFAEDKKGPRQ